MPLHSMVFENITVWDSNRGLAIQQRDGGDIFNITFRACTVQVRYNPPCWWGSAEPIYISSMPRAPGLPVGSTTDVLFEDITCVSENSVFLSGRSPGQQLVNITLRNVNVTIDKWSNYSFPVHSYVPTSAVPPLEGAPVDGVYMERAAGVLLDGVHVAYNPAHVQPFWSRTCVNTTNAGAPVTQTGGSCSLW